MVQPQKQTRISFFDESLVDGFILNMEARKVHAPPCLKTTSVTKRTSETLESLIAHT